MAKLTLVRGLPGSGKSTYAKTLEGYKHFESDMFFVNDHGVYKYDIEYISVAHDWCYSNVVKELINGHNVVVSNTFCAMWEMDRYLNLLHLLEEPIRIVELRSQFGSIHNVPEQAIARMKNRWFDLDYDDPGNQYYTYEVIE